MVLARTQTPAPEARARQNREADPTLDAVERALRDLCGGADRAGLMATEHLATGGKRVRARLALAAGEALGAPLQAAIPWAAAVELLHNATLVHDDIQDGDHTRRGHPTVWARHGVAQAINAGDLMLMLPWLALTAVPADDATRFRLGTALADRAQRTVRGQADEMALLADRRLDLFSYLRVVRAKTGHLLALPVEGAALLAGRSPRAARALAQPFEDLGVLFQLQDDVVDLYGDKGREAPGADLREGKVSVLVVTHLERHPEDRAWLEGVLLAPRASTRDEDVTEAIARFRSGGALAAALHRIEALAGRVSDAPELRDDPRLQRLARQMTEFVLSPLTSLWSSR